MNPYERCVIKSFKHDGRLHRMWLQNWLVPAERLMPAHAAESMIVLINDETPVEESSGKRWTSKVPAVTVFIPKEWFNIVALLEPAGVRYYCNVASPVHAADGVLTYIDYDLDVIRFADGSMHVVDRDEYEANKQLYHYPAAVRSKIAAGLGQLINRIKNAEEPFCSDKAVRSYFTQWKKEAGGGER
ncbi:hypothetical protein BG53_13315 [Paenibacillus darwinianus]|uniref:DUF402 domain-containing protein n=1 Tax=Paenibacillus darwinianus TaxID=1380763 RepID=A0A9W5S2M2_9BACL|nr:DUF402 domain-containing protein [Paenibacillus darwinianus]EXX87876.1 hypothetical protein CH50_04650 [Paenibacillus darwinianus]EXX90525.1 hypothetical protein BG53_13315 [Paenibacillus darwinianus]EXX90557.1 hypothetical protein BG52_13250 [Paenibacillus darwinianus]